MHLETMTQFDCNSDMLTKIKTVKEMENNKRIEREVRPLNTSEPIDEMELPRMFRQ